MEYKAPRIFFKILQAINDQLPFGPQSGLKLNETELDQVSHFRMA